MRTWVLGFLLACFASAATAEMGEAEARKARSMALLQSEGIPTLEALPLVETEAESIRRTEREVAERTIALAIVAVMGETRSDALTRTVITQFGAEGYFTPEERAFLDEPDPTEQDYVDASWRYEGVHVLLWALGIFEELERPDHIADVPRIAATLRDLGTEGLIAKARLRPQSEILDAADLIYRTHWAVVEARLHGTKAPAGLEPGVVFERHYALNWLILRLPWDEIPTDT